jgi:hypothetical protein
MFEQHCHSNEGDASTDFQPGLSKKRYMVMLEGKKHETAQVEGKEKV